jgi:transposase
MRDVDFLTALLELQRPWSVERSELDSVTGQLHLWLRHRQKARFRCPDCGQRLPLYDHTRSRCWRHLDHGSWLTWLHTQLPRVRCPTHGVRQVPIPWALSQSRFSIAFETHAIKTLLEADVLGASRLLRLSWDEAWGIMERAVERGLKAKRRRIIPRLGIDEKAFAKRHRYLTLVSDLDRGTIEFIEFDRKKSSLDAFYRSLSAKQLAGIEAVAMDMWEPFISSTTEYLPQAADKIVFDRFHLMKHMLQAVDQVRKAEHRRLQELGDATLTKSKYLWLFSEENLPERYAERFALLKNMHLQTARAWAIKESFRDLWNYQRKGWAERHWQTWYFWATHSQLAPVVRAARTVKNHLANVLTYFDHRITTAVSEGLNSKIQTIKKTRLAFAIRSILRSPSTFTAAD